MSLNLTCQACGFEGPRVWSHCVRCATPLPEEAFSDSITTSRTLAAIVSDKLKASGDAGAFEDETTRQTAIPPVSNWTASIVGQQSSITLLQRAVDHALRENTAQTVVIEGSRGSGKTRLLRYAAEYSAKHSKSLSLWYLQGPRSQSDESVFAPFSRLIHERFAISPSDSPTSAVEHIRRGVWELLGDETRLAECVLFLSRVAGIPDSGPRVVHETWSAPELQRRMAHAVRTWIESQARKEPLVLLLDDMDHVRSEGWELLHAIGRVRAPIAIFISGSAPSVTYAKRYLAGLAVHHTRVQPFDEDDIGKYLRELFPIEEEVPRPILTALAGASFGNPSVLRDVLQTFEEEGLLIRTKKGTVVLDAKALEHQRIPETMRLTVEAKLSRLDDTEVVTLERAAIVGEVFWDGVLLAMLRHETTDKDDIATSALAANMADKEALAQLLTVLVEKGMIEHATASDIPGVQEFRFRHPAARPLLYRRTDSPVRRQRHAVVARWLTLALGGVSPRHAARIAPHLRRSGQRDRAGLAYLSAAQYERRKMRTATARRYLEKAVRFVGREDPQKAIEAWHEYGATLSLMGQYDTALQAFEQVLQIAWQLGSTSKSAAAWNRMGRIHRERGKIREALNAFELSYQLFRSGSDLRGMASSLDDIAQVYQGQGELDRAWRAATEALENRRRHEDTRGEAVSLSTLGAIEHYRGNLQSAERCYAEALSIRQRIGDQEGVVQSQIALGAVLFDRGDLRHAHELWKATLEQAETLSDLRSQARVLTLLADHALVEERVQDARQLLLQAKRLAEQLAEPIALSHIERLFGQLKMKRGEDAQEILLQALELARTSGHRDTLGLAFRAMGQWHTRTLFDSTGQPRAAEALKLFDESLKCFRHSGNEKEIARTLAAIGVYQVEQGDWHAARGCLQEARAMMQRMKLSELEQVERLIQELSAEL